MSTLIFKPDLLTRQADAEHRRDLWPCPSPFVASLTVGPEHMDEFGHTNNTVYLVWMQAVAALHSKHLGLTFDDFVALGSGCVARHHDIHYKRPSFAGDTLWVATWISRNEGKTDMLRQYHFVRASDLATIATGSTQWVCIDMNTGRPKRQPPEFLSAYRVTSINNPNADTAADTQ